MDFRSRVRGFTCFPQERPSFQVYEPLENSLHALDSDSSLLLQLLRGYAGGGAARLSWLRHFPTGTPAFPFSWSSYHTQQRHDMKVEDPERQTWCQCLTGTESHFLYLQEDLMCWLLGSVACLIILLLMRRIQQRLDRSIKHCGNVC